MKTGTFNDKLGIYQFDGKWYKPRYYANSLREGDVLKLYNTCIAGLDASQWPHTVFVTYEPKWNQIKEHYPGLYAQSQLHYYWPGAMALAPAWAAPWEQSGFLLIHEYEAGKVAWMRDESKFANEIYMFMVDSAPPEEDPSVVGQPVVVPPVVLPGGNLHVTGKIWFMDVDLHITTKL